MSEPPATFGDATAEYLALRTGCGLVAGRHGVVWVRGPDAVEFLQGLISQDVTAMAPGQVARSLLLGPQGKLRAILSVLRAATDVGLVCDAGRVDVVVADLSRFKIRVDVVIEADARAVFELWGPTAEAVAAASGCVVPAEGWAGADATEPTLARIPFAGTGLSRLMLVGADRGHLVASGAIPVGALAETTVRIEAGEPVVGVDVDDSTIPAEAGIVGDTVSFTKGCYLGQELVARIDSRGRVNRHLRGVVLSEAVLPPLGAEIVVGDDVVGAITSVGESLELRAPVGMGLVRREVEPGSPVIVRWDGGHAHGRVEAFPLDRFGAPG